MNPSDFVRVLDLRPEYALCNTNNTVELRALARIIALRVGNLKHLEGDGTIPYLNIRARSLAKDFRKLATTPGLTVDAFNVQMTQLFNWSYEPVGKFGTQHNCQVILE